MKTKNQIQDFILKQVKNHADDLVTTVASRFKISRQRAHLYVAKEVKDGNLIKTGQTRASRYFLTQGGYIDFTEKIKPGLEEDQMWLKYVKPILSECPENIYRICSFGKIQ